MSVSAMFPDQAFTAGCPTREVLDHVMSRWAPLILASLADAEPLRWSELRRRADGISEKMLAQTLKLLECDGFVRRDAKPVVPPHVEYSLTPLGHELAAHVVPLLAWIAGNADAILSRQQPAGTA